MSSANALERLVSEKDKLSHELERTRDLIRVSEACETLVAFTKTTADPFALDWKGSNPWLSSPDNAACKCIVA